MANPDLDAGIGYLLSDVSRLLRRDFDRRVRALELTQAQWRAIAQLARDEGMNQATLAERLEVTPITLARLVDRLEAAGWVRRRRDSSDRRASRLFLTAKVKPVLEQMNTHAAAAIDEMLAGVTAAQQRTLIGVLKRIKQNLSSDARTQPTNPPAHEKATRAGGQ